MNFLYIAYRTRSGFPYIYDTSTNEIIRLSERCYSFFSKIKKTAENAETDSNDSCTDSPIRALVKAGFLKNHVNIIESEIGGVVIDGSYHDLRDFASNNCAGLVLELTQKCNLRCEYCCFGDCYDSYRRHSNQSISYRIAKKSIEEYCKRSRNNVHISFYGGEPLLEYDLLQEVLLFAERHVSSLGKKVDFAITTNGTLLTKDKLKFLTTHDVTIHISLDGDKKTHDAFRVFENGTGSFDVIQDNITYFVDAYPDYSKKGFSVTLTSASNLYESDLLFSKFSPKINIASLSYVRELPDYAPILGCPASECDGGSLQLPLPPFYQWTDRLLATHNRYYYAFIDKVCDDPLAAFKEHPLLSHIFLNRVRGVHYRSVGAFRGNVSKVFCFPGVLRLFCSSDGIYYPCERVDQSPCYSVGNVWEGLDIQKMTELTNMPLGLCNCANCCGKHICGMCLTDIQNDATKTKLLIHEQKCQSSLQRIENALIDYTSVMEKRPDAFATLDEMSDGDPLEWLRKMKVLYK